MWFGNTGNNSIGRISTVATPSITKFTPTSGTVGTTVTIKGQNLLGATAIVFDGTPSTITSDTATKIVTTVPAGATSGRIHVTVPAGTAISSGTFTVT